MSVVVYFIHKGDELLEIQLEIPYDPDFIDTLRTNLLWPHIKFHGSIRRWGVDPELADEAIDLCEERFGPVVTKDIQLEEDGKDLPLFVPWPSQERRAAAVIRKASDSRPPIVPPNAQSYRHWVV